MSFTTSLRAIGQAFEQICANQQQAYFWLDRSHTKASAYELLKDLYDEDKEIRIRDSYNTDQVKRCLIELKKKAEKYSTLPEYRDYLVRFMSHIGYNLQLVELVEKLEALDREVVSTDDRILYLLNYCTICERTSYFQGLFITKLDQLNTEIQGINYIDYNIFYRIGALNFKRHLYKAAIASLNQAISIMEKLVPSINATTDIISLANFKKMLFKAKMLRATSYEFQGDCTTAIQLLVGKTHESLVDKITLEKFLYSLGDALDSSEQRASLDVLVSTEQDGVIYNVQTDIVNELIVKPELGSCFKYALETDQWFAGLNSIQKKKIGFLESGKNNEYYLNESKNADEKYIYFQNENVHEVLHILAHTLNEHGVAERNRALINNETNPFPGRLLVTARALMLYVAKNQKFMLDCQKCLTCLATIYAEVGDFESAKAQLLENANSNYYKHKDQLVQAEIEFFYYLISLMDNPSLSDELRDAFFEKYSDCCYNNFDYDALTQIEMYRFKYLVATAILTGQRTPTISSIDSELKILQDEFNVFLAQLQFVFVSDWTKNEHDKINIMFQFLTKYYGIDEEDNTLNLLDLAKKYLYLYAKSIKFIDAPPISILEESEDPTIIQFLDHVFHQPVSASYKTGEPIQIRNCIFRNILKNNDFDVRRYLREISEDNDNIYFIATNSTDNSIKRQRHIWINSDEETTLRYFLIHCAFDSILYDFVNPQNIFILVPFVGAEPLKYQLDSFSDLVLDVRTDFDEHGPGLKRSQRDRISSKFLKNYSLDHTYHWVETIFEKFSAVEMILWNDEDIDTIYSKERFYIRDVESQHIRCYPLMNHPQFIVTLDDIINCGDGSPIHDACPNNMECCQYIIDWRDSFAEKMNSYFCLRSFCREKLYNRKIIVKYSSRKKHWRIIVVKMPINQSDLSLLQAYICDNSEYIISQKPKFKEKQLVEPTLGMDIEGDLESQREKALMTCGDKQKEADDWCDGRKKVLSDTNDQDAEIKRQYDSCKDKTKDAYIKAKKQISEATDISTMKQIPLSFQNQINEIKGTTESEIKKISKGV